MAPRTILVALSLILAHAAAAEETVHIGMVRSISNGAELMAIEKGYFKDAGIKLDITDIDTSANTIALLATNRLQVVAGGISAGYFNALEKQLPITIIADRVSTPIGHELMLRGDLKTSVTTLAALKRKIIGTNGVGSVSTYEIGKLLESAGLRISDVDVKVFPYTQMAIAFTNKALDAALMTRPSRRSFLTRASRKTSRRPTFWSSQAR
jgi:NitT/TauT family transport system substrate-binding protein